jgi:hypothetical protein
MLLDICKLEWITFGVIVHFLKHHYGLEFVPHQIVVKFYEKWFMYVIVI